jgi:hypothetical protein
MAQWNTMSAGKAVTFAQMERIFGDCVRALEDYNPDHPLSHGVRIESARQPKIGQKAFLLMFSIAPLIEHHGWSATDVFRALVVMRPELAAQFAQGKGRESNYVLERLLDPTGVEASKRRGRPAIRGDRLPPAFGFARMIADKLQKMPNF